MPQTVVVDKTAGIKAAEWFACDGLAWIQAKAGYTDHIALNSILNIRSEARRQVDLYRCLGYRKWAEEKGYGRR